MPISHNRFGPFSGHSLFNKMTSVLSSLSRSSRTASLRTNAFSFASATKRTFSYRSCVRNVAHEQQQQYRAKQTSRLTPTTILLGVTPILTFALGTWQIQRLKWKVDLIDELQEKLQRPPMVLPDFVKYVAHLSTIYHNQRVYFLKIVVSTC